MNMHRALPNSKVTAGTSRRIGWPFLGYWLAHILLLAFAAWPVVLETFEPSKFVGSQSAHEGNRNTWKRGARSAETIAMARTVKATAQLVRDAIL